MGRAGADGDGGAAGRSGRRRAGLHDQARGVDGSAEQEGVRAAGPPRLHDRRAAAAPAGLVDDAAAGGPITRNLIFGVVGDKFSQAGT